MRHRYGGMNRTEARYYAVWLDGALWASGLNRRAIHAEADGSDSTVLVYETVGGKKGIKPIAVLRTSIACQNVAKQARSYKGDN